MLKVVEGIYKRKSIKLLMPLNLPEGQLIKATVIEVDKNCSKSAKRRQLRLLNKGIDMGKILVKNRKEIHEK